jgi:hypothetical protein
MSGFFISGERKIRPGTYIRYFNRGTPPVAGVDDGVCAAVFRSNWGSTDVPVLMENFAEIAHLYGDGGAQGTTAVPFEQFRGGARRVVAIRLGSGGTKGTLALYDTSATAVTALLITLLYPGSREFSVTVRPSLSDPANVGEMLLLDGTVVLERFEFATTDPARQAASLLEAVKLRGSAYFTLTAQAANTEALALVTQTPITPGTDPVVDAAAYSRAYELLEAENNWNMLSTDTNDTAIAAMTQMYLNRVYAGGMFVMGVLGEQASGDGAIPFDTRITNAAAYNDYQIVYVGNGFVDMNGDVMEGWLAAARVAGMIAATPSDRAVTRTAVRGAVDISERLTNRQVETALASGMFVFTRSSVNTVWVEQGINSLVLPKGNQDDGWKKIKRAKVRFELFGRLTRSVDPLIGRINNDDDGRMTVVQLGNEVCNTMVAEGKLLSGAHVELDPANPPQGDSAWFLVFADDIDALEKAYFGFGFRFAPDEA